MSKLRKRYREPKTAEKYRQRSVMVPPTEGVDPFIQRDFGIKGKHVELVTEDIVKRMATVTRQYPIAIGTFYTLTHPSLLAALRSVDQVGLILQRSGNWIPSAPRWGESNGTGDNAWVQSIHTTLRYLNRKNLHVDMFPWDDMRDMVRVSTGEVVTELPGVAYTGRLNAADCHSKALLLCTTVGGVVIPQEAWISTANPTKAAEGAWNIAIRITRREPGVLRNMLRHWCNQLAMCAWMPDPEDVPDEKEVPIDIKSEEVVPEVRWGAKKEGEAPST